MGGSAGLPTMSGHADSENAKKAEDLQKACMEAFYYAPALTSCSHAVFYVVQKLINKQEPYRIANEWITYATMSKDWHEVNVEKGWKLANEGKVVVGGRKDTPDGHVIVIYPGTKIVGGGYKYSHKNLR